MGIETISYMLCGGNLQIDKGVFVREMLRRESLLKPLLKPSAGSEKGPGIVWEESEGLVRVDFRDAEDVDLGEFYEDRFKALKRAYGSGIRGTLTIRVTCYNSFYTEVKLDGETWGAD